MPSKVPTRDESPHQNIEAEKSILAAILLDNKNLAAVVKDGLCSSDFFFEPHKVVFGVMIQMADSGAPIDYVMLNDVLHSKGLLRDPVDVAYVMSLADDVWHVQNLEHHVKIVRQKAALRQLVKATDKLSRAAQERNADLTMLQTELRALATVDIPTHIGANGHLAYGLAEFMAAEFPTPEHLIEVVNEKNEVTGGLIPCNSTVLLFSMPHHLKSYFTTAMALACTTTGIKFGKLLVKRPMRTYLVQMEDFPGQLQWRIRKLAEHLEIDEKNFATLPRCDHKGNKIDVSLPNAANATVLKREFEWFAPDLIIFDVLRRIVNIDLNSPKDSASFLEQMDGFRYCPSQPTLMLVHHENRKEADIMYASAGSYNLPGWANVVAQFKRKREENGVSHVEIEVDNKLAQSPEPMRMVLDLHSETPVRLENVEDTAGLTELRNQLGNEWTVRDLAEVMNVHKTNATRRLSKFIAAGVAEKCVTGKRGRQGGLARYRFIGEGE
jgi:DnaB-like helicase N terminal domain/AAA domain